MQEGTCACPVCQADVTVRQLYGAAALRMAGAAGASDEDAELPGLVLSQELRMPSSSKFNAVVKLLCDPACFPHLHGLALV